MILNLDPTVDFFIKAVIKLNIVVCVAGKVAYCHDVVVIIIIYIIRYSQHQYILSWGQ